MNQGSARVVSFPDNVGAERPYVEIQKYCPVCDSKNVYPVKSEKNDFGEGLSPSVSNYDSIWIQLLRCRDCTFGFTKEKPLDPGFFDSRYDLKFDPEEEHKSEFKNKINQDLINFLKDKGRVEGKLLDVGSFAGIFIENARKAGFQVEGVELNPTLANYCREKLNLNIQQGSFMDLDFPAGSYDVLSFIDVLEHLWGPKKVLHKCHQMLKPGGHILIKIPNLGPQLAKQKFNNFWGVNDLGVFDNYGHVNHFSQNSLKKILELSGFEPLEVRVAGSEVVYGKGPKIYFRNQLRQMLPAALELFRKTTGVNFGLNIVALARKKV